MSYATKIVVNTENNNINNIRNRILKRLNKTYIFISFIYVVTFVVALY